MLDVVPWQTMVRHQGSPKNSFAVRLAAPPTDLVSVEEVIVHYDTVIVELNPTELVSVES